MTQDRKVVSVSVFCLFEAGNVMISHGTLVVTPTKKGTSIKFLTPQQRRFVREAMRNWILENEE